jgi:hypothetical protein
MLLIGLGHKCRQGKDTVAKLWAELNEDVKLYSFANALKEYCKANHDTLEPRWQYEHQTKQKPAWKDDPIYGCTPILQWWGAKMRETNEDCWVDMAKHKIDDDFARIAVITDVRYQNEAEFVKSQNGFLVDIVRRNADGSRYISTDRDPNHISETALDEYMGWDYILMAKDGDIEALNQKATTIFNNIQYDHVQNEIARMNPTLNGSIPDSSGYSL